jgi:glyoxylase-like metal-dependent hydrolase (beta-lactamase superfamily II)
MSSFTLFVVGGCAGSFPSASGSRIVLGPGPGVEAQPEAFQRIYGGRTTSYFLRHRDTLIIVDQGSGVELISALVLSMFDAEPALPRVVHFLQTHCHNDHWCGLLMNRLLYRQGAVLRFYSPVFSGTDREPTASLAGVMRDLFPESAAYWPVTLSQLDQTGAVREHVSFRPGEVLALGPIKVRTCRLPHEGGCCGFRFEFPDAGAVVLATDHEPAEEIDPDVVEFFDGAAHLLCDLQYRDDEYEGKRRIGGMAMSRKGWGHGTPSRLFPTFARCRRLATRLRMVHHDPSRDDDDLDLHLRDSRERLDAVIGSREMDYQFARDGDILRL